MDGISVFGANSASVMIVLISSTSVQMIMPSVHNVLKKMILAITVKIQRVTVIVRMSLANLRAMKMKAKINQMVTHPLAYSL